ncbi:outer membrane protein [Bartonella sp. B30(2025)]
MNIKRLMATSVIALTSISAVQAADIMAPKEESSAVVTFTPAFSWTGFYLGGQVGNFSSNIKMTGSREAESWAKDRSPKVSGFTGGVYAGSNMELGHGVILSVETDAVWQDREDTKPVFTDVVLDEHLVSNFKQEFKKAKINGDMDGVIVENAKASDDLTFRTKWSGATRVRLGYTVADRMMPYIAGGISYAQIRGFDTVTVTKEEAKGVQATRSNDKTISGVLYDTKKTMVGYALGAGVDFAIIDNVILRAEYRYSDFGKVKLSNESYEAAYKTNDFRVGVAYKF